MRYLSEFRNPEIAAKLLRRIRELSKDVEKVRFMEVCGTHTMSLHRYGIKAALPENVVLLSGPGCPVCVTPNDYIDKAIEYSKHKDITITTFGDMVRVPGSRTSLEREKADGADVFDVGILAHHEARRIGGAGVEFAKVVATGENDRVSWRRF